MKISIILAIVIALSGCAKVDRNNFITDIAEDAQYLVTVTSTSGAPVPNAVVCLDYDAGSSYAPPKFRTDSTGEVSIPHRYAEKFQYDWISIEARIDGRAFISDRIWRRDVRWPLRVVLGNEK